ncbi:hypothetical protein Vadar_009902 [Vaccinium darrowii]|uniref:Uncharacterized protein n=1 Tax=Vaccinium darrowii TaxID=229202 RepID=A0ACB7Y769_9ERIC|nr:hypothetical protein Vadar_009902 [Vaccinium darrowii]
MGLAEDNHQSLLLSSPAADEEVEVEVEVEIDEQESNGGNLIRRIWLESKKTWLIAGPSIFTRIAMFSLTVITQSFAGHLSDLDLAAISIVTTVVIGITFGFLLGMASALETLCAFVGLWEFFKLSVASGVMLSLESFYYRVLIIVAGKMQNAEVALDALSICITILAWESMIPLGFFAATGVRVANELGAGNAESAKFASIVCVFTSLFVGLLFWVLILAIPDQLAMIFTSTTSVITMVKELSILLSFTVLLNCIQPVLSGVAVGSGWQALVAFVNLGSYYIVGVPLGLIMSWLLNFGIEGLWCGMISGTVVQTLILTIITVRCKWVKQVQNARVHTNNEAATN